MTNHVTHLHIIIITGLKSDLVSSFTVLICANRGKQEIARPLDDVTMRAFNSTNQKAPDEKTTKHDYSDTRQQNGHLRWENQDYRAYKSKKYPFKNVTNSEQVIENDALISNTVLC